MKVVRTALASPNGEPGHFALIGKVLGAFQMACIQYDPNMILQNITLETQNRSPEPGRKYVRHLLDMVSVKKAPERSPANGMSGAERQVQHKRSLGSDISRLSDNRFEANGCK